MEKSVRETSRKAVREGRIGEDILTLQGMTATLGEPRVAKRLSGYTPTI
jgi:hypothetical protein